MNPDTQGTWSRVSHSYILMHAGKNPQINQIYTHHDQKHTTHKPILETTKYTNNKIATSCT